MVGEYRLGAQFYLPKGTPVSVLGYWYPNNKKGLIGNDTIVIPKTAQSPHDLANQLSNFFLDEKWGYENFAQWNGYQPPFTSIDPSRSRGRRGSRETSRRRVLVDQDNFTTGYIQSE